MLLYSETKMLLHSDLHYAYTLTDTHSGDIKEGILIAWDFFEAVFMLARLIEKNLWDDAGYTISRIEEV